MGPHPPKHMSSACGSELEMLSLTFEASEAIGSSSFNILLCKL